MRAQQKVIVVRTGPEGTEGLTEVNERLKKGWSVESVAAMGGGGAAKGFAAVVVLARAGDAATQVLSRLEDEVEEPMDGDGSELPLRAIEFPSEEDE